MRIVVISPHFDDAVISIGGTIHAMTHSRHDVSVVTVFGGDPDAMTTPSYWDSQRGSLTQGAAVRMRRSEDEGAVSMLGATPVALQWADSGYVASRVPDKIWHELVPILSDADVVVLPGWPLSHADHRYTTMLVLERIEPTVPIAFYAELPYAAQPIHIAKARVRDRRFAPLDHAYGAEIDWRFNRLGPHHRAAKDRAVSFYAGELRALGRRAQWLSVHRRLARGEWLGIGRRTVMPTAFTTLLT